MFAYRQRGKNNHHHYRHQIFDNKNPQDNASEFLLEKSHVIEGLEYDGRGRHGQHSTQKNTAHVGEPHCIPRHIAYEHHATYNSDSGNDSRNAHIYQFLERKVQSHREQQKNDTDVRPYFDIGRIGNSRDQGNGRTRHNTGYNVAQYDRLLQPLENDGYNTGNNQNYGKIRY